ncbi:MAG: diguanylate cyclase [Elusimicrobia bacterium]|nr:diguanylate cyclase [Elusimicrobiota bacterium]
MTSKTDIEIEQLRHLNALARTIAGSRSLYDVLQLVLQTTLDLTRADEAAIFSGNDPYCLASLTRRGEAVLTHPPSSEILTQVIHSGLPRWVEPPEGSLKGHPPRRYRARTATTGVCLPLRSAVSVVGAFYLGHFNNRPSLNGKTVKFLQAMAEQITPTIETLQYLDDQRRYVHELERALRTHQEIQQRVNCDPVTHLPNHAYFREHLAREFAVARRYHTPLGLLLIELDHFQKLYQEFGKAGGDGVLGEVARVVKQECRESDVAARCGEEAIGIILPNTEQDGAVIMAHRILAGITALKVTTREDVSPGPLQASIGVASLRRDDINAAALLDRADQTLETAHERGGNRIERWGEGEAEPLEVVKRRMATEKKKSVQTVVALAAALAAKDKGTHSHSEEMAHLAAALGHSLGLNGLELEELEMAAYLHDVGKLGVPEEILLKPKALDKHEWLVMKAHPKIGRDLILEVFDHRRLAEAIYYHHERWDGKGYPEGLKAEQIPQTARIVMVLDAYAAMTCDRPYRKALSKEAAMAELRRHAGTQFDPQVVERFLALLQSSPDSALHAHPPAPFIHHTR